MLTTVKRVYSRDIESTYYYTPLPLNLANKQASNKQTSTFVVRFGCGSMKGSGCYTAGAP